MFGNWVANKYLCIFTAHTVHESIDTTQHLVATRFHWHGFRPIELIVFGDEKVGFVAEETGSGNVGCVGALLGMVGTEERVASRVIKLCHFLQTNLN
ncbi:hypothetical protein Syun_015243 [Stephania yunnanensis]|uniref:Uncharacterized protein n=1 Tax=Stephania yunnanensis TaxID=152371 RepID=A0AAP0JKU3_9MAGN